MPKCTALVHVESDSKGVEETLKSLEVANDVLVVVDPDDNGKEIRRAIHKAHGRIKTTVPGVSPGAYAMDAYHDWVLILRPGETLTDAGKTWIEGWKKQKRDEAKGYRIRIRKDGREEDRFRLVNRLLINWTGELPPEPQEAEKVPQAA